MGSHGKRTALPLPLPAAMHTALPNPLKLLMLFFSQFSLALRSQQTKMHTCSHVVTYLRVLGVLISYRYWSAGVWYPTLSIST